MDILNIEIEEDSNIDESENFNVSVWTYLAFEGEYKEFIIIRINFNIIKNDNEEYPYDKDDLYLEFNNVEYYNII